MIIVAINMLTKMKFLMLALREIGEKGDKCTGPRFPLIPVVALV